MSPRFAELGYRVSAPACLCVCLCVFLPVNTITRECIDLGS